MNPTLGGLVAIICWSSTVAFSRSAVERMGPVTAAAVIYLTAGLLACAPYAFSGEARRKVRALPSSYLKACGATFVAYTVSLYGAIGAATDRQQVVDVGLLNYLWPSLTLLFSVPVLGARARWFLAPGLALAGGGVVLAMTWQEPLSASRFAAAVAANPLAYGAGSTAAVCWGLYNNLSRRLAPGEGGDGVPLFLVASGMTLLVLRAAVTETSAPTGRTVAELAYLALVPTVLAYRLWDRAMRAGHLVVLACCSYLTPLLSTVLTCWYLGLPLGSTVLAACGLVVGGALVCKAAVTLPEVSADAG